MTIDDILPRVKEVLHKISGIPIDQIGNDDTFDALELDSLSRIEMLVELEREFQLEMPEDSEDEALVQEIQSVSDAARLVLSFTAEAV